MRNNYFTDSSPSGHEAGPITRALKMIPKGTPWWLSLTYGLAAGSIAGGIYGLWLAVADSNILFIPASQFTTPYAGGQDPNNPAAQAAA